jgi:tetratricopeptide (TPR) repeat protein
MRAMLLVLALGCGGLSLLQAQKDGAREPKRPILDPGRDSNSAAAYYYQGISLLPRRPKEAAAAFYWAIRLEPGWAEPRYARAVAILLSLDPRNLTDYFLRKGYVRKLPEVLQADSLDYQALLRNPLLDRRFDVMLVDEWIRSASDNELSLLDFGRGSPRFSGWMAHSAGRFADAVKSYGEALKRYPRDVDVHLDRALAYVPLLQYDSARADINAVLDRVKELEESLLRVFADKALLEFSIGKLFEVQGQADSAREYYGRALLTDLSFFPAHAALGAMAEARGDTSQAVKEYDLAVQVKEDDPTLRYQYGGALFNARRYEESEEQFQKAIDLEPWYAKPYFPLAYIRENQGKDAEAAALYETFAERAPGSEAARIAFARQHAAELGAGKPKD